LPVKIILGVLLVLEVIVIAFYFWDHFSQYFTIVALGICIPLAYFIFQYLRITLRTEHPEVQCYEAIQKTEQNTTELTNNEVDKLINSEEYRRFRDQK
jgi:ABC-type transport system involved in Fe-S cluster assembly fused permease/ATPase subunit